MKNKHTDKDYMYLKTLCRTYESMIYRLYKGEELSTGQFYNLVKIIERFEKNEQ